MLILRKTKLSTQEFVDLVFDKLNIILLSGESFGAPNYIRIACTLDISILKEAFDRLETLKF